MSKLTFGTWHRNQSVCQSAFTKMQLVKRYCYGAIQNQLHIVISVFSLKPEQHEY